LIYRGSCFPAPYALGIVSSRGIECTCREDITLSSNRTFGPSQAKGRASKAFTPLAKLHRST